MRTLVVAACVLMFFSAPSRAAAVLIPAGEEQLRDDLNRLADRGVLSISTSTWPLPLKAVSDALAAVSVKNLSNEESDAHVRVTLSVARLKEASLRLVGSGKTDEYRIPRSFAREARGESEFGVQASLANTWAAGSLRVNQIQSTDGLDDDETTLDGTYLGVRALGQIASIGLLDRWWGPTDQGSLILGSAARSFPALSIQRASLAAPRTSWLSWIGPWNYQILFGQLLDYDSVPGTKFFGLRMTVKPFDLLELAASRTMQFGGEGRQESLSDFSEAFFGHSPGGRSTREFQLGGYDFRLNSPFKGFPAALYGQLISDIGEDADGLSVNEYVGTLGLEYRFAIGSVGFTWRAEGGDTNPRGKDDSFYLGGTYPDGYYQHGLPIGYPIGGTGDLYLTSLSAVTRNDFRYELRLVRASVNELEQAVNLAYPESDIVKSASLKISVPWKFARIEVTAGYQDSESFGSEPVARLSAEFDLRRLFGGN